MTIRSSAELANRFHRMSQALPPASEDTVQKLGDLAATIYKRVNRVRIPRNKPVRWGGKATVIQRGIHAQAKFRPSPRGFSQLVEGGSQARAWFEGSRYAGGSRKSREAKFVKGTYGGSGRRAVLNIPGIGYRRFVVHPGIGPIAHPLQETALALRPGSRAVIEQTVMRPLIARFKGG